MQLAKATVKRRQYGYPATQRSKGHMDEIAATPVLAFQAYTEKTVQNFIDYRKFSKWTRILRATAYVMRAARIFKDKELHSRNENPTFELTSNNMIAAKNFIFKQTQRDSFNPEVNVLTQNKPINTTSRLRHLSPCSRRRRFLASTWTPRGISIGLLHKTPDYT